MSSKPAAMNNQKDDAVERLYRVVDPETGLAVFAFLKDGQVFSISGNLEELHALHRSGVSLPEGRPLSGEPTVLTPTAPSKIVCVGLNYRRHAEEMNKAVPEEPLLFLKPPTALIASGQTIELPPSSQEVHHEGELAIIIGQTLRQATEDQAREAIFGYTCALDITARDIQRREKRYTRAKGFDTFAPLGPAVALAPEFDPSHRHLSCFVNGELRQHSRLDDFIFPIPHILSFISSIMTLLPGDVILTGTPAGVGPIVAGDEVRVEIEGIGALQCPVRGS